MDDDTVNANNGQWANRKIPKREIDKIVYVWNYLPKLSPHNADDIKCNTNNVIIPNGKWPAIIILLGTACF